ncbi:MAG: SGNH/GDSL hydrolase family protein [Clostridia bacterium]|nr:SGNH/GDSL hydrolase family protein [Clostridia bacterium]
MKKLISALLAATMLVSLSACGGKNEEAKENANPEKEITEEVSEEKAMATILSNSYYRLTVDKELNVAYLGGSITQGAGASVYAKNWVALTTAWLSEKFPEATINENNAGISNTGSNYGIYRLEKDIFDVAIPDLIFIEYTSNDWGRFGELNISRQNESIIRKLYEKNPKVDIVFLFTGFSHDGNCRRASTALAKHYGLPVIDPGSQLKTLIDTEEGGVYDRYSRDKIHPNDEGYAFYIKCIDECFSKYLIDEAPEKAQYIDIVVPEPLNKDGLFMNPQFTEALLYDAPENFKHTSKSLTMGKIKYDYALSTDVEGAVFEFDFEGTGFGLLVYKTPKVSSIEYSVDGGEFIPYAIGDMHNYNHGQMYIIEHALESGKHNVKIKNVASQYGTELNILGVCTNK